MAISRQLSRRTLILENTDAEVSTAQTIAPEHVWTLNGEQVYPVLTSVDTLHHIDSKFVIHECRISAKETGSSVYRIVVTSTDVDGINSVTHIDTTLTFSTAKGIVVLPIAIATIDENRTLELSIEEQTQAVAAKDISITLMSEDFSALTPIRNGHIINDSVDASVPQRENLKFGDNFDVTEDVGADQTIIDLLLDKLNPVGSYKYADLTEVQFQAQMGTGWVLADGRSVIGSEYETVTGNSNIPDVRGTYLRMKDNGAAVDPNGDPALGSYQDDEFESHTHVAGPFQTNGDSGGTDSWGSNDNPETTKTTTSTGGNETRPKTTISNIFIRIN